MHIHRGTSRSNIAIVGGESLLGKEVRELLEASNFGASVTLIASDESADTSVITRGREEPLVMSSLEASDVAAAKAIVLAGSAASSRKVYQQIRGAARAPVLIDLTGALEDRPDTRLRAPMLEPPDFRAASAIQAIAHPAAIALGLFLIQLQKSARISRSVIHIFEPASERGHAGIDELQKQTVSLLSFKPLQKDVYDEQVSFNMLAQYGSDSPHSLAAIELKIDRHLASLLAGAGAVPMPSLRLIHAPVFHGYSMSLWVEFEANADLETIEQGLASSQIDVRGKEHEPPTNVGVAGQSGITVGAIAPDRNQPRACWFWMVADNLRIAAGNAAEVAREVVK
ncbi:MAG TPA: Asd/ArgC dimerization domain-containing protein [Candidatus Sulfopaludibacter sp.]|nr:Asd/ArgC dimerization domain-containing protein [Candidatus Sulfopaludibacter sp.]